MELGIELISASVALLSVLVAVVAILLAMYMGLKERASFLKEPYKKLIILMTIVLIIGGGITCSLSIACLLGVTQASIHSLIIGFFILLVLMIVIGVSLTVKEVLKENVEQKKASK